MDLSALNNSTILITGSTGMIGQNIVRFINELNMNLSANISIIAHGRTQEKVDKLCKNYSDSQFISTIVSDIAELNYNGHIDYIIHAASITGGSKQHLDFPMRTLATSIDGSRRVLDIAKNKCVKGVVFLSSLEVYGNTGTVPKRVLESDGGYIDPMNPRSSYSEGKRISECLFSAYAKQYNVRAMVARLTASFGYGASSQDNRVFAQFARSIINKKDIILKSTGETVRDYCDAMDVATALLTILAYGEAGEAYNVANMDTEISIKDLAQRFIDNYPESGSRLLFDLKEAPTKFGYNPTMYNVLDSSKLQSLGWQAQYSIDDMIHHLVDYMEKGELSCDV